ncbi:MAG: cupin domain-containing protein [Anaerolineae bacterium]|nr:cupin domain-containing protein [Anaerolineae bacterium]
MNWIKTIADYEGSQPDKFYKTTLFRADHLLLGLNCLEPGQVQKVHDHADQDKFYMVVAGRGRFQVGDEQFEGAEGQIIWAPAGIPHGVSNENNTRLTLLVGIAPAP